MGRVTQAHIDSRTDTILDAATKMFILKGFEAATMHEIATEAGLSAGAIYRYFASKEALLRAVCAGASEEISHQFAAQSAAARTPMEAMLSCGRAEWEEMARPEHRDEVILYLETALAAARRPAELGPTRREIIDTLMREIGSLVRQAQESGELSKEVDPRSLAQLLLAAHVGTAVLGLQVGATFDPMDVFESIKHVLHALSPQAASSVERRRG